MIPLDPAQLRREHPAFGRWLLAQAERTDAVGQLAKAAALDRQFPRDGDPQAVAKRLNAAGADGDIHQALEDAELDWSCY